MRVLWFSQTPGGASDYLKLPTIGGGWIVSLGDVIKSIEGLELAVCFFNNEINEFKFHYKDIIYYPVKDKLATRIGQVKTRLIGKLWDSNLPAILNVINDFKPDIIHIFGTESGLGDIVGKTKIPIIIHLQGLLNPYLSNWLPRGISLRSILFKSRFKELALRRDLLSELKLLKKKARREEYVIKNTQFFFGRTAWDERVIRIFNPGIEYFHCDEVLRTSIYKHSGKWQNNSSGVLRLVSTVNAEMYKGLEMVLLTAEILKYKTQLNFEWNIIGVGKNNRIVKMMEKNNRSSFKNVPIIFNGVKKAEEVVSELLSSNLFIHPSHIDNSPNSVCEAMLLGMPVIAGFVGGIPSLIKHEFNGLLYNSYDPYDLAGTIIKSANNQIEMKRIGKNASTTAIKRHDPAIIVDTIKKTYEEILFRNKSHN